jgi:hypothetical protein
MRRSTLSLLAAAVFVAVAATPAAAQIRFSVGAGGVSVGNVPPSYSQYGYSPYGRPYYAETLIVDRPYAVPVTRYVRPVAEPPYSGPGVTIRNPGATVVTLSYTIDSRRSHDLAAGESQQLTEKGRYLIEFDRGGDFGRARYTIAEGTYEFTLTDHGWELYRQADAATHGQRVKSNPLPMAPLP